jgi:hypothetical protein
METVTVRVGQIWEDNDRRITEGAYRRRFKVLAIEDGKALVETMNNEPRRRTKIKLDRFKPTSTGYRIVSL